MFYESYLVGARRLSSATTTIRSKLIVIATSTAAIAITRLPVATAKASTKLSFFSLQLYSYSTTYSIPPTKRISNLVVGVPFSTTTLPTSTTTTSTTTTSSSTMTNTSKNSNMINKNNRNNGDSIAAAADHHNHHHHHQMGAPVAIGETNLDTLLATMNPVLDESNVYVFCKIIPTAESNKTTDNNNNNKTCSTLSTLPSVLHSLKTIKMLYYESEGITLIVSKSEAEEYGLSYQYPCCCITLNVHSSLDAVGFLARITTHLATSCHVSVNAVSAYHHDHLLIPESRTRDAMMGLQQIMIEAKARCISTPDVMPP